MKTKLSREELREIASKSTNVVAWYSRPYEGQVRGPFGRWFSLDGGDNGMGDPIKYPTPVAPIGDDCDFAAAAMNNLVPLLDELDLAEKKIAELQLELILMGRAVE